MKLIVQEGPAGRGVFAAEPIPARRLIVQFTGPFLCHADTTPQTYALQIGPDLYIGASGSYDDYINHACDPNAGMVVTGAEARLHAIRDIAEGEEITFDYSTVMAEDDFEMTCHCGHPNCRKLVRDGKHLPQPIWDRYLHLGILPDHVVASRKAGGGA